MQHAANYTGKQLKPAPPVYSPQRVADAIFNVALKPKKSTTTDLTAPMLKLAYAASPTLAAGITAKVMEKYFESADTIFSTNGNVLSPAKYGTSVLGGWKDRLKREIRPSAGFSTIAIAGLGISLLLLSKLKD